MTVHREVLAVIGVGGMGQAIVRRLGPSKTVLLADNNEQTLASVARALTADGYDVEQQTVDVSSPESVHALAEFGLERLERLGARAGDRDGRALRMERPGDRPADAAGRAGDEGVAPREVEHLFRLPFRKLVVRPR